MLKEWITIELTSGDCGSSLQKLLDSGIQIRDICAKDELTVQFRISAGDLDGVRSHCVRNSLTFRIIRREGLLGRLPMILERKLLICGLVLILALCLYIPEHVLFVTVEGNRSIPENRILEAAELGGIRIGVSRRKIQNERLKHALLSELADLQWAGINTYGSLAVITVREREPEPVTETDGQVSDIIAERDGIILTCTVTKGTGLVTSGQAVRKGQTLISGYSDFGITIGATRAEGDVYALTSRSVTVKTPDTLQIRSDFGQVNSRFSLRIGKKRINFYKCSGILDAGCVKMKREYVLTLPGGLMLPVALIQETFAGCETEKIAVSGESVFESLSACGRSYLRSVMIAGEITGGSESIQSDAGVCFYGVYTCREMIGRVRNEEIGVYNETD